MRSDIILLIWFSFHHPSIHLLPHNKVVFWWSHHSFILQVFINLLCSSDWLSPWMLSEQAAHKWPRAMWSIASSIVIYDNNSLLISSSKESIIKNMTHNYTWTRADLCMQLIQNKQPTHRKPWDVVQAVVSARGKRRFHWGRNDIIIQSGPTIGWLLCREEEGGKKSSRESYWGVGSYLPFKVVHLYSDGEWWPRDALSRTLYIWSRFLS